LDPQISTFIRVTASDRLQSQTDPLNLVTVPHGREQANHFLFGVKKILKFIPETAFVVNITIDWLRLLFNSPSLWGQLITYAPCTRYASWPDIPADFIIFHSFRLSARLSGPNAPISLSFSLFIDFFQRRKMPHCNEPH
jgi:hypothetical protein